MNNTTLNNIIETIDIHPVIKVFGFLTCFWIIIAHSAIVVCFYINKSKPWTNYSRQILSLSFSELTLGVVCLILFIITSMEATVNYVICAVGFYFFFTVLCGILYHVLAICIFRALMLMKKSTNTKPISVKLSVLLVILASITSVCLCAVPFILWSKIDIEYVPRCRLEYVFQDKKLAMGFLVVSYLLPMIFTNIVYAVTCYKLWIVWRKAFRTIAAVATINTQSTSAGNSTHSSRPSVEVQKSAVITIGILLFFFNLFSIPLIVVMSAEMSGNLVPRSTRITTTNMFVLNSAISPFIYAIRTAFLRDALKNLVRTVFLNPITAVFA